MRLRFKNLGRSHYSVLIEWQQNDDAPIEICTILGLDHNGTITWQLRWHKEQQMHKVGDGKLQSANYENVDSLADAKEQVTARMYQALVAAFGDEGPQ